MSLFMYFTIDKIRVKASFDNPWDPFDHSMELFQTFSLSTLEAFQPNPNEAHWWARQGFSLQNAPSDGTSLKANNQWVAVRDPQITFALPAYTMIKDRISRFRLDVHHWESDNGKATELVRLAFNDATLRQMAKAWEVAKADEKKAGAALEKYLKGSWDDLMKKLPSLATTAAPGVVAASQLAPVLDMIFEYVRANGTDYLDAHRMVFETKGTGDSMNWRVVTPSNEAPVWIPGEGVQVQDEEIRADGGKIRYDVRYKFRCLD